MDDKILELEKSISELRSSFGELSKQFNDLNNYFENYVKHGCKQEEFMKAMNDFIINMDRKITTLSHENELNSNRVEVLYAKEIDTQKESHDMNILIADLKIKLFAQITALSNKVKSIEFILNNFKKRTIKLDIKDPWASIKSIIVFLFTDRKFSTLTLVLMLFILSKFLTVAQFQSLIDLFRLIFSKG